MMTVAELTQARADVAETLVSDALIERPAHTISDAGYTTESWSTVATVKGRIDNLPRQDSEGVIASQESGRAFYRLTVAWDADLQDGDRVTIAGVVYEVTQINPSQDYRIVRRGMVVKVG